MNILFWNCPVTYRDNALFRIQWRIAYVFCTQSDNVVHWAAQPVVREETIIHSRDNSRQVIFFYVMISLETQMAMAVDIVVIDYNIIIIF